MKKTLIPIAVISIVLISMNVQAGQTLRHAGNLDPEIAQPNSNAFGKSLNEWMETYLNWMANEGAPEAQPKNTAFLPIVGESPFEVEVKVGTKLILPAFVWLGFPEDELLPDEWFGDEEHIFAQVFLDGEAILEPNEDYYVESYLDPPLSIFGFEIAFYQAIVCVIKPLPPGWHQIVLHSEFIIDEPVAVFDNTWNIWVHSGKGK